MPTTEAPPPQPPSTEGQGASPRRATSGRSLRRGNLEGLEEYDLVHVIDELEDERARVQLREKIWIALILHLVVFLVLLFLPRYLPKVKVRDNSQMDKKQMTYMELPPELIKKPKVPAPPSDQNRQQQTPHPTPDQKTLQQLEAMRKAGPPLPKLAPAPTPKPQAAPPAPQPPQQQPNAQPKAPPPVAKAPSAPVEAPKPQPTKPNFNSGAQTPEEAIQQATRQASRGGATYGGDGGANAPSQHPGTTGAVDVLSDTLGVDFGPYIQRVIYDTKRAWYPIIPEVAQPPISKQGKVLIRFKILPDGSVKEMHLEGPSGDVSLDRAAWGGIVGAAPFRPLPKEFKGPFLELRFYFLYNDQQGIR